MNNLNDWKVKNRIRQRYERELKSITNQIFRHIENTKDPKEIIRILSHMSNSKSFQRLCEEKAFKMVTAVNRATYKSWREAALNNTKGKKLYEALLYQVRNSSLEASIATQIQINTKYIRTLPTNIAFEVTELINSEASKGMRAGELAEYIKSVFPEKSKANATLIARTEVSKSQTALTQARAESLGLNWYIWRTSEDSRVRSSHDFMEGVLVRWSDPPNPELLDPSFKGKKTYGKYHAGNIFNCRCYPEPVIDIDDITFPCRVYYQERTKVITRAEFLGIE